MAKDRKKGLGTGLGALFGEEPAAEPAVQEQVITELPVMKIEPRSDQPRRHFDEQALQELAESIEQHGMIQPITVRPQPSGYYQIIAGERRWRAARMAGLEEVPVLVVEADDRTVMELALIENLQREDLNPMEEAAGYRTLADDYHMTQEEIADRVGKSRAAVANSLRLLSLSDELADMVRSGKLTPGHARALLSLKDEKLRLQAAQRIIALQLSVRQAETLCRNLAKPKEVPKMQTLQVDYISDCERSLSRKLGRRVRIINGKRKGHFELEFYGPEDLNRLLFALQKVKLEEEEKHG